MTADFMSSEESVSEEEEMEGYSSESDAECASHRKHLWQTLACLQDNQIHLQYFAIWKHENILTVVLNVSEEQLNDNLI